MWFAWTALLCGIFGWSGPASAAAPARLALHECRLEHPLRVTSSAARCGVLTVAEDPTRPTGASIGLRIAVVPALNRRSTAAPLIILAGGPGQAATDLYTSAAGAFARINRNHDIVLLDQRGTGGSAPLACPFPEDWQNGTTDDFPDLAQLRRAARECLAKFGDRVRYYTTSVAVGDLDRVRRALGYGRVDLYAASYGTRVAELYLRRHGEVVDAAVLDGVTYPEQVIGPDIPADAERALQLIVSRCAEAADCHAAYPRLPEDLLELRRRFGTETQPLSVMDPGSGLPFTLNFNRGTFNAALRFLSYSGSQASLLPTLLHQGATGNLVPLGLQALLVERQLGEQIAAGMQTSVICSEDAPYFPASNLARQRLAQTYQGSDQVDALVEICKLWPRGPVDADLHHPLVSPVPTLLLSGEADPVTPPADAERTARGLAHHRSLVLAGEGHGQLATGCIPLLMAQFLDNPDPEGLDTACLERHRPAPFFVGMTGPAP